MKKNKIHALFSVPVMHCLREFNLRFPQKLTKFYLNKTFEN